MQNWEARPIAVYVEQDRARKSTWSFIARGGRSGVQLMPEVGGPERTAAHDVPLLQHEELVLGEREEVAAIFSMSVRADHTFLEVPAEVPAGI